MNKGINHVGLATQNIEETVRFYTEKLGFSVVRYDRTEIKEGGFMRHVFLDCGAGQTISFLCPENVPAIGDWDVGINRGLGVPSGFYHFAFHADSELDLEERQAELLAKGVAVSPVKDHDWCKSIYFVDPVNNLSLEYAAYARAFNEDDKALSTRANVSIESYNYNVEAMIQSDKAHLEARELKKAQAN